MCARTTFQCFESFAGPPSVPVFDIITTCTFCFGVFFYAGKSWHSADGPSQVEFVTLEEYGDVNF